ncbi:beta-glucan synthesis-associated [Russula brevipes]|nr:beta-glucan synthesis-associated [Russula brevipes]
MYRDTHRYYASDFDTPSTTNLLTPSGQPSVQAALARGPRIRPTLSSASLNDSPYPSPMGSKTPVVPSISSKVCASPCLRGELSILSPQFSLSPDPASWGSDLSPNHPEPDDYLHNPDPKRDRKSDQGGSIFTCRGLMNLGCLALLIVLLLGLFAGYPIVTFFTRTIPSGRGGFGFGGINSSGQAGQLTTGRALIDTDTPQSAYTLTSFHDSSSKLELVFSDEFNLDDRTFYPGDDPYWEAVDLHYWATGNLEWYDPVAITTKNGALEITFSEKENHGLNYTGGFLASWNKFCFTGGVIVANVSLPGASNVVGLWPAVWTMGNLGRAGYGASTDGMWPYSYDSCDFGTLRNQTLNGQPVAATSNGDPYHDDALSYLPGQRLSRCTCPDASIPDSHPGPKHSDGSFMGRSAPEIDIFEATAKHDPTTGEILGQVSQSFQIAPFDFNYTIASSGIQITDETITEINTYKGGVFQQAVSALSTTDQTAYELNGGGFSVYGFEYLPDATDGYITWISNNKASWTLNSAGVAADQKHNRITEMTAQYIIVNLGMSPGFGKIEFDKLQFPTTMKIDYIRVYQDPNKVNVGCNPPGFPTEQYIQKYLEAYTNPNLTTWQDDFGQPFPKNNLTSQC